MYRDEDEGKTFFSFFFSFSFRLSIDMSTFRELSQRELGPVLDFKRVKGLGTINIFKILFYF